MSKLKGLLFIFSLLFVLTACNDENNAVNKHDEEEQNTVEAVTVTDAYGKEITLTEAPERIVSLIPSNTEILFALGLGEKVVGVNDTDNYPPEVESIQKIGGMEYNLEMIISLKPDLVLAHESGMYGLGDGVAQLEAAGIPVFVVKNAVNFKETYETIEQIGLLTGRLAEAKKVNENIQTKLSELQQKVKGVEPKTVFVVVGAQPEIYAVGKGTYMDEMLNVLGIQNAVTEPDWPVYSAEDFVASDADIILTTYEPDIEAIKANPLFATMKAVKSDQLLLVDGDTTSRQGPRLAEGVEKIAKAVYPELFNE
jgi:iron complex transport system substrate-binding protein